MPESHDPRTAPFTTLSRRAALRIGGAGGISLAAFGSASRPSSGWAAPSNSPLPESAASFGRAKSVILFFLLGGPSQHDTWDPKPDAPSEVRGEFKPISSALSGLSVGELMPRTAKLTDRLAVIRSMITGDNSHSSSGYQMLTGVPHIPLGVENATKKAPNIAPCAAAIVKSLRAAGDKLPASIVLPEHVWNDGNISWPGQDAGFLGLKHDPWLIPCDPSEASFQVPALSLPGELTQPRFNGRRELLAGLNRRLDRWSESAGSAPYDLYARQAVDMLTSSESRGAFDIKAETEATRDRYGRTRFGQSTLLARRLVEAGVSLVQVNWTRVKALQSSGWDTHANHHKQARDVLMPMMDQTYSALLEDLEARGLLDETLVVWTGEFGRSPRVNGAGGRDHWGRCFSIALAGAGIRRGTVFGASNAHGGEPARDAVTPADLWATIYHCLGYHPDSLMHDPRGRPLPISRGSVIRDVLI
ncbi:MAG: DUF1501 domain-containing protein [Planctomycetia bacterium]|nr:DUF1501 domain-containing protein [Planctomycetia bacterium]